MKITERKTCLVLIAVLLGLALAQNNQSEGRRDGQNEGRGPGYIFYNYSSDLGCAQCIMSNYTFCINNNENQAVNWTDHPSTVCCRSASYSDCPYTYDSNWNCSSSFSDKVYAKYTCPQQQEKCGSQREFVLSEINQLDSVAISNLSRNDSCFYKLRATCGAPIVRPNTTSFLQVEYIEFSSDMLYNRSVTGYNLVSNSSSKVSGKPGAGMPARDRVFEQGDRTRGGEIDNATSGSYDSSRGGAMIYGNADQSVNTQGKGRKKNDALGKCYNSREMYVAVSNTATDEDTRVNLLLQFESVDFETFSFGVISKVGALAYVALTLF